MVASDTVRNGLLLLFCTAGIYAAYLTQGVVSEHLQMKRYGSESERFTHLESLNGAQSLVCFIWAYVIVLFQQRGRGSKQPLPSWMEYWKPALTNSIGPALGMMALKNISYPAQVSNRCIPTTAIGPPCLLLGVRAWCGAIICMRDPSAWRNAHA